MIDLHTHLLPGVDDGADSLEAFEAMLEEARRTGITRIAASRDYPDRRLQPLFAERRGGVPRSVCQLRGTGKEGRH